LSAEPSVETAAITSWGFSVVVTVAAGRSWWERAPNRTFVSEPNSNRTPSSAADTDSAPSMARYTFIGADSSTSYDPSGSSLSVPSVTSRHISPSPSRTYVATNVGSSMASVVTETAESTGNLNASGSAGVGETGEAVATA